MYVIDENDDEAERLARRAPGPANISNGYLSDTSCTSYSNTSTSINLSPAEITNQITQCLKLSAEDKINDKNAFQLKLIDLLAYTLKSYHPSMNSLQMASACLDASGKIYGFRVDKVHSDLIKIVGIGRTRRNSVVEFEGDPDDEHEIHRKKRRKKRQVICSVTELKGKIDSYNALASLNNQRDAQTSDMLHLACLPHHNDQSGALSLYNDVLLDHTTLNPCVTSNVKICKVADFRNQHLCPTYASFKFLGWSADEKECVEQISIDESDANTFHFDYDDSYSENKDDKALNANDDFDDLSVYTAVNDQEIKKIEDFQDLIENSKSPNMPFEYSYLDQNIPLAFVGPPHWKAAFNKNYTPSEVEHDTKRRKLKDLTFSTVVKNRAKQKFDTEGVVSVLKGQKWLEKDITLPETGNFDQANFNRYFNRPMKHKEDYNIDMDCEGIRENVDLNDNINISNFGERADNLDESGCSYDDDRPIDQNSPLHSPSVGVMSFNHEAFVGQNLVSLPKIIETVFIPYSQRAKKINMKQLKKAMWVNLKMSKSEHNKNMITKEFHSLYSEIPEMLTKNNAESLSPAIAFVSLLHLANERNLSIQHEPDFSDMTISSADRAHTCNNINNP